MRFHSIHDGIEEGLLWHSNHAGVSVEEALVIELQDHTVGQVWP